MKIIPIFALCLYHIFLSNLVCSVFVFVRSQIVLFHNHMAVFSICSVRTICSVLCVSLFWKKSRLATAFPINLCFSPLVSPSLGFYFHVSPVRLV